MSLLARPGTRREQETSALRQLLEQVVDPEIGRSIGELGMLGEVRLDRRGTATVTVRLTTSTCPLVEEFRSRCTAALAEVPSVRRVEVEFTELSARERAELAGRLRADRPALTSGLGGSTRIYAVASGKGGVGKSSVTANLAVALADSGKRVGVLDADVWGYSIPGLFGVSRSPVVVGGLMMPVRAHGVALMSTGFLVPDGAPVVWRGPMLHKALEQFLTDVHWGELDVLLLDLPPGTGDVQLSLLELLPDAALLAVTTPQPAAQGVAARVVTMAREASMPIAGVIENMSSTVCDGCGEHSELFGSGGGAALAELAQAPLLGKVPLDRELRVAGDLGTPVVRSAPHAASAQALAAIATTLPTVRRSLVGRALPLTVR
ncbi:MAG TPA: P-loop NTPase [Sporichthyaceae bacterium]|jgi:ATP-binding protein involved in chromosome partitioning|nr:P-loop NTPase [Sporichthyaceae bacterium]